MTSGHLLCRWTGTEGAWSGLLLTSSFPAFPVVSCNTASPLPLAKGAPQSHSPQLWVQSRRGRNPTKQEQVWASALQHPGANVTPDSWRQKMDMCQLSNNSMMEFINSGRRLSYQLSWHCQDGHEDTEKVWGVTQIFINCYQISLFFFIISIFILRHVHTRRTTAQLPKNITY